MTKIEINIPDKGNRNNLFKDLLLQVRDILNKNDSLEWKLAPLWNTKLISEYNLRLELIEKFWIDVSSSEFFKQKKLYENINKVKIQSIRDYSNISKSEVYLLDDVKWFKNYLINKNYLNE